MKLFSLLIGGCLIATTIADMQSSESWYLNPGFGLQTRVLHLSSLLGPQTQQLQRRGRAVSQGGSSRPIPAQSEVPKQKPAPPQRQKTAQKQGDPSSNGIGPRPKAKGPVASAKIQATGSASLRAITPDDFRDAYVPHNQAGHVEVSHKRKVLAAGSALGTPGGLKSNAAQQPIDRHPLVAQANARAVMGQVKAPKDGKGHIKIETLDKTESFEVKGGTRMSKSVKAPKSQQAKVTASVTDGGDVRVVGGPTKKSLNEFPLER